MFVNQCWFLLLFLTVIIKFSATTSCTSFNKVKIEAYDKYSKHPQNFTINGCFERIAFNNKTITQIYVREQKIPILGKDSVRNLVQLTTISFYSCRESMKQIQPSSFRNVPRLRNVQISFCGLNEIPRDVFNTIPSLEILRLHNNQIDIIEDNAFSNLHSLKIIHADNNLLEYWNREWFTNTTNLEVLNFQNNTIRTLPRRAFYNLPKLKRIFFDFNEINTIHAEAFKGIHHLEYLGLRYNRLKSINENIFPNDLTIISFMLDANYLNFLPNEILKKVSVKDITIDNNPWKCPCLERILYWMYERNGTVRISEMCTGPHVPVCGYPKLYSRTCIETVDEVVTKKFVTALRKLKKPLTEFCARLY